MARVICRCGKLHEKGSACATVRLTEPLVFSEAELKILLLAMDCLEGESCEGQFGPEERRLLARLQDSLRQEKV